MTTTKETARRPVQRQRRKISVTVDPELLNSVDAFVADHPQWDRSRVFDHALYLWCARLQDQAMEAQFREPESAAETEEQAAWTRIRAAAAKRVFNLD